MAVAIEAFHHYCAPEDEVAYGEEKYGVSREDADTIPF